MSAPRVWTIGHSSHDLERFQRLLVSHGIEYVIDVRSYPYSRFAPQFNRENLAPALRERGIGYGFLGEQLGGRPSNDDHYDEEGRALYGLMSCERAFQEAVLRVERGARTHRVALMCSEGDPHDCHRRLLVGKVLAERGATLEHILPDGSTRAEASVDLGDAQQSLFGGP